MARKKIEEDHDNHERWLISYADFITLLFAFFVVMYAISSVNTGKYRILSNSLGSAFSHVDLPPLPVSRPSEISLNGQPQLLALPKRDSPAIRHEKEQMTDIARSIQKTLAPLVNQGKVRISQSSKGVSVEINASVLFAPGDAKLTSESVQALRAVSAVLKNDKHAIQVEGYTDNLPISTPLFASNWELSAARASSVVRLFSDNGIADERLTAVGHSANKPVGSNDTPDGRTRNRRVEVVILSGLPEVVTDVAVTNPTNKK